MSERRPPARVRSSSFDFQPPKSGARYLNCHRHDVCYRCVGLHTWKKPENIYIWTVGARFVGTAGLVATRPFILLSTALLSSRPA